MLSYTDIEMSDLGEIMLEIQTARLESLKTWSNARELIKLTAQPSAAEENCTGVLLWQIRGKMGILNIARAKLLQKAK